MWGGSAARGGGCIVGGQCGEAGQLSVKLQGCGSVSRNLEVQQDEEKGLNRTLSQTRI